MFETKLDAMVRDKVEQIVNTMLDAEADEIANAARYERTGERKVYRAGRYDRRLTAKVGRLGLKVPKLKGAAFESAVIERYRRREESVGESLIGMYLAGVSTRQVDDISQLLWCDRMPSQTLSDKPRKVYGDIDAWHTRPLEDEYPYVSVDGVWHKRSWGGAVESVSVLVAIGINREGRREVIGVAEGMKEDSASWEQFVRGMIERGLKGVRLVVGDRCAGLVATVDLMLPKARYQRCMVHFMRNVLSRTPPSHREWASAALKAVFAMESRESALAKAGQVAAEMESRKLRPLQPTACARASARRRPICWTSSPRSTAGGSAPTTCSMGGVRGIGGIAGFWRGFAGFAPSCGGLLGTFAGRGGHRCCTVVALALWSAVMRAGRFGGLPFRGSPA